jgi:hypothetical protein
VMGMDLQDFTTAIQAMDAITHQEMLQDISCIAYPHMDKAKQGKKHRDIFKRAYPSTFTEQKQAVSIEEAAKILRQRYGQ